MAVVVLADIDERILLGELAQRRAERPSLVLAQRQDHGLQRRTREAGGDLLARRWDADGIADADRTEPTNGRHLARQEQVAPGCAGRGEHLDSGRLRVLAAADAHTLPRAERPREQAHVGDPLAGGGSLDLEHAAGDLGVRIARGGRQQLVDAFEQRVDPDAACR